MNIQHMIIDNTDATATIDYSNRPSAKDAAEILLGFEIGAYYVENEDGEQVEITIDEETRNELEALAEQAVADIEIKSQPVKTQLASVEVIIAQNLEAIESGETTREALTEWYQSGKSLLPSDYIVAILQAI